MVLLFWTPNVYPSPPNLILQETIVQDSTDIAPNCLVQDLD